MKHLGQRRFTEQDQDDFAALSGDANPVHVDAVAARRTVFGGCVVHGVHALAWALDCAARERPSARAFAALEARFVQAIRPGDLLHCRLSVDDGEAFAVIIERQGVVTTRITGRWGAAPTAAAVVPRGGPAIPCRERNFADAAAAHGSMPLWLDERSAARMFPALGARLPAIQLAALLATTRLVGMECPGRHSLLTGLELAFGAAPGEPELAWRVARADARFASITLAVRGPGVTGTLAAFARPAPRTQPAFADLARAVTPGEASGQRVLIVGGSRGLGEVAAKLLAAGGAAVCVSYARGTADANRLREEIRAGGGDCSVVPWDVTTTETPDLPWPPNALCYFATPHVAIDRHIPFSVETFNRFVVFYVAGMHRVVDHLMRIDALPLSVLYPSTRFLDEAVPYMAEYCAAKAAGEELCRQLGRRFRTLRFHTPRLPRMATDQTVGLAHARMADPVLALLPELRALYHPV